MRLLEAKSLSRACIYKLVFPDGKCYVGQTKCLGDRVRLYENLQCNGLADGNGGADRAISEFGIENVDIEVLCYVDISNRSDLLISLSVLEIKYIKSEGTLVPNGYNTGVVGEVLGLPAEFYTALSGVDVHTTNGSKSVLHYDLGGNFVAEYESVERCAYDLGVPSKDVSDFLNSSRRVFRGEYMLMFKRYGEVPANIAPYEPKLLGKTVTNIEYKDVVKYRERVVVKPNDPILKYNLDGEYCGTYESLTDAAMSIGRNNISKGGIHRGYIFLEHDGGDIEQNIGKIGKCEPRCSKYTEFLESHNRHMEEIEERRKNAFGDNVCYFEDERSHEWGTLINDFKVGQYSLKGELIAIHEGVRGASRNTGINYANIWACVMGRTKKCQGYRWKRCDESGTPLETAPRGSKTENNAQ